MDYADEDIDSNSCDIDDRLCGGYAETKWVAEKLVQRAESRGLPTIIYRLGRLSDFFAETNIYWKYHFWKPFLMWSFKFNCHFKLLMINFKSWEDKTYIYDWT